MKILAVLTVIQLGMLLAGALLGQSIQIMIVLGVCAIVTAICLLVAS